LHITPDGPIDVRSSAVDAIKQPEPELLLAPPPDSSGIEDEAGNLKK